MAKTETKKSAEAYRKTRKDYLQKRVSETQESLRTSGLSDKRKKKLQEQLKTFKDNLTKIKEQSSLKETKMAKQSLKDQYRKSATASSTQKIKSLEDRRATLTKKLSTDISDEEKRKIRKSLHDINNDIKQAHADKKERESEQTKPSAETPSKSPSKRPAPASRSRNTSSATGTTETKVVTTAAPSSPKTSRHAGGGSDYDPDEGYSTTSRGKPKPKPKGSSSRPAAKKPAATKPAATKPAAKKPATSRGGAGRAKRTYTNPDIQELIKKARSGDEKAVESLLYGSNSWDVVDALNPNTSLENATHDMVENMDADHINWILDPKTRKDSYNKKSEVDKNKKQLADVGLYLSGLENPKGADGFVRKLSTKLANAGFEDPKTNAVLNDLKSENPSKTGSKADLGEKHYKDKIKYAVDNIAQYNSSMRYFRPTDPQYKKMLRERNALQRELTASRESLSELTQNKKVGAPAKKPAAKKPASSKGGGGDDTGRNQVSRPKPKAKPSSDIALPNAKMRELNNRLIESREKLSGLSNSTTNRTKIKALKDAIFWDELDLLGYYEKLTPAKQKELDITKVIPADNIAKILKADKDNEFEKLKTSHPELLKAPRKATPKPAVSPAKPATKKPTPKASPKGDTDANGKRYTKRGVTQMLKQLREQQESGRKTSNAYKQREEDIKRLTKVLKTLSSANPKIALADQHRIAVIANSLEVVTANTVWGTGATYDELAKALKKLGIKGVTADGLEGDFDEGDGVTSGSEPVYKYFDKVLGEDDSQELAEADGAFVFATLYIAGLLGKDELKTLVPNANIRKMILSCK